MNASLTAKEPDMQNDLTTWTGGALPLPELEDVAFSLFEDLFPRSSAAEERISLDIIRKGIIRAEIARIKSERVDPAIGSDTPNWQVPPADDIREARWLDAFFASQLANVTALHIYGKPLMALRPSLRADIRAYADSYTEDACDRYSKILDAVDRVQR